MIANVDLGKPTPWWWGEGHAPFVAVLLASAKSQTSPSLPPKGADRAPQTFFPANRFFLGAVRRGHHRHLGPLAFRLRSGRATMPSPA
jgi:hypothetical protein